MRSGANRLRAVRAPVLALVCAVALAGVQTAGAAKAGAPSSYRWDDKEGNQRRIKEMIDYADDKPAEDPAASAALLQEDSQATTRTRAKALLGSWRSRHELIEDAEERRRKVQEEQREQVARLQMELARKRSEGSSLLEVEQEMQRAGGEQTLYSSQRVAGAVFRLARATRKAAKVAHKEDSTADSITKFLEQRSFVDGADAQSAPGTGEPDQPAARADVDEMVDQYDPYNAPSREELRERSHPAAAAPDAAPRFAEAAGRADVEPEAEAEAAPVRGADEMRFRGGASTEASSESGFLGGLFGGGKGKGGGGGLNSDGQDTRCSMCVYYMEMIERDVGFPQRTSTMDSYPSYGGETDYQGPGAYFKGVTGRTPPVDNMAEPVPGPGFVYSFLELASKSGGAKAAVRRLLGRARGPADSWDAAGDYSNTMSEGDNLRERLRDEVVNEPREEATYEQERVAPAKPLEQLYSEEERRGGDDAIPLDAVDPAVAQEEAQQQQQVKQQQQPSANPALDAQRRKAEAWMKEHPEAGQGAAGPALLETQASAKARAAEEKDPFASASSYDPSHDPFLGMRPEDTSERRQVARAAGIEEEEEAATPRRESPERQERQRATGFLETQARVKRGIFGSAMQMGKQAIGMSVCRDGVENCRPMLRQDGRRALERRARIQTRDAEFSRTRASMEDSLRSVCNDAPKRFQKHCLDVYEHLDTVVDMYLHDYDDEEICSDIQMCVPSKLGIPQKPRVMPSFG